MTGYTFVIEQEIQNFLPEKIEGACNLINFLADRSLKRFSFFLFQMRASYLGFLASHLEPVKRTESFC